MANNSDNASPFQSLKRLVADEEASAAIEFIILIPVYMTLMGGLFMFANLAMARQALVQDLRFAAWSDVEPKTFGGLKGEQGSAFFGPYDGELTYGDGDGDPEPARTTDFMRVEVKQSGELGWVIPGGKGADDIDGTADQDLAVSVLNNEGQNGEMPTLRYSHVRGTFKYEGILAKALGLSNIKQSSECMVVLPYHGQNGEGLRSEYDPTADEPETTHPVLYWKVKDSESYANTDYYNPRELDNLPISPNYESSGGSIKEFPRFGTSGGTNVGVWDVKARIGGGPQPRGRDLAEKAYLAKRLPEAQ